MTAAHEQPTDPQGFPIIVPRLEAVPVVPGTTALGASEILVGELMDQAPPAGRRHLSIVPAYEPGERIGDAPPGAWLDFDRDSFDSVTATSSDRALRRVRGAPPPRPTALAIAALVSGENLAYMEAAADEVLANAKRGAAKTFGDTGDLPIFRDAHAALSHLEPGDYVPDAGAAAVETSPAGPPLPSDLEGLQAEERRLTKILPPLAAAHLTQEWNDAQRRLALVQAQITALQAGTYVSSNVAADREPEAIETAPAEAAPVALQPEITDAVAALRREEAQLLGHIGGTQNGALLQSLNERLALVRQSLGTATEHTPADVADQPTLGESDEGKDPVHQISMRGYDYHEVTELLAFIAARLRRPDVAIGQIDPEIKQRIGGTFKEVTDEEIAAAGGDRYGAIGNRLASGGSGSPA